MQLLNKTLFPVYNKNYKYTVYIHLLAFLRANQLSSDDFRDSETDKQCHMYDTTNYKIL
jgi:hypothetical protein